MVKRNNKKSRLRIKRLKIQQDPEINPPAGGPLII